MREDGCSRVQDPWAELGLEPGAGDAAVREAYLVKVKEYPPDREPIRFERIREAYERLRNPLHRAGLLLDDEFDGPLVELLGGCKGRRSLRFVGPKPWLAALGRR